MKLHCITLFLLYTISGYATVNIKQVEQLISAKCVSCHKDNPRLPLRFGKAADFNNNKKLIAEVVASNYMPMWKADASYSHFDNETTLTDTEKKAILDWCNSDLKLKKITASKTGNHFSKYNFSISLKDSFAIPATGKDVFATIKIPFEFDKEQIIRGIELINKHPFLVHHASIFIVKEAENLDVSKGVDRYIFPEDNSVPKKDFHLYNEMNLTPYNKKFFWDYLAYKTHWQFGMSSYTLPDSCGFVLPKKGAIVIDNIHYKGNMEELKDAFTFNFIKSNYNKPRQCISTSLGNGQLSSVEPPLVIQPNAIQTHYSVVTLPDDMSLMEVTPHMHQLGRQFQSFAITPAGDTIKIIRINDWDADWQETYRFNPMLHLPKGAQLFIRGVFDNTSANIKNPNSPPKVVGQSMNKHDEMLEMLITFFPYKAGDESGIVKYTP